MLLAIFALSAFPLLLAPLLPHAAWRAFRPGWHGLNRQAPLSNLPLAWTWGAFWLAVVLASPAALQLVIGQPYTLSWALRWSVGTSGVVVMVWYFTARYIRWNTQHFQFTFRWERAGEITFHVLPNRAGKQLTKGKRAEQFLADARRVLQVAALQAPRSARSLTLASPWLAIGRSRERFMLAQIENLLSETFAGTKIIPVYYVMGRCETLVLTCFSKQARKWRSRLHREGAWDGRFPIRGFSVVF